MITHSSRHPKICPRTSNLPTLISTGKEDKTCPIKVRPPSYGSTRPSNVKVSPPTYNN